MPDIHNTKQALATALKFLLQFTPFAQISVGDICKQCQRNRKSFYYHFRDKYDLVNWIFQSEFIAAVESKEYSGGRAFMEDICQYFYTQRDFYQKALQITGQNSFQEYLHQILASFLADYCKDRSIFSEDLSFFTEFYSDAITLAMEKWLCSPHPQEPAHFVAQLARCLQLFTQTDDALPLSSL